MTLFIKTISMDRCRAEVAGWHAIRAHLPVPRLLAHHPVTGRHPAGGQHAVVFEDIFANRRCAHLLGDCIGLADHGITDTRPVRNLVHAVCADLLHCLRRTGQYAPLGDCVPALYLDRLRPSGRLDTWYPPGAVLALGPATRTLAELAATDLIVNDTTHRLDVPALLDEVRGLLDPGSRWNTAVTQGDPTEPNIGYPRMWLDFEHSGRNTLAGDVANLLWYLLGMGGWLVPTYQPAVYQRTLRHHLTPVTVPHTRHWSVNGQRIQVSVNWSVGAGRATALHTMAEALAGDLGAACAAGRPSLTAALRPFLVCRVLGVINLNVLTTTDRLLCLATLAQLTNPNLEINDLLAAVTIQHPPTATRGGASLPQQPTAPAPTATRCTPDNGQPPPEHGDQR